jgi:hypothetical protein
VLTAETYQLAWLVYTVATLVTVLMLRRWWQGRVGPGTALALFLVLASVLLTPAHPDGETPSYAPALVVAGFDLLTHGPEAALRPLRPIGFTVAVSLVLGAVVALVAALLRRRRGP